MKQQFKADLAVDARTFGTRWTKFGQRLLFRIACPAGFAAKLRCLAFWTFLRDQQSAKGRHVASNNRQRQITFETCLGAVATIVRRSCYPSGSVNH